MYRFTEDCYIGIPEIDQEHLKLFQLINEAVESMKQPSTDKSALAKHLLNGLKEYTLTHFSHEEAYMEKINDPELPKQKKEHIEFITKINSYSLENSTNENAEQTMQELCAFLIRWLYHHILSSDMMIGKIPGNPNKQTKIEEALTFSSKYYTHIAFIDEEHKKLFDIIREAYQLVEEQFLHDKYDKIIEILNQLKEYTEFHFKNEETYMKKINYSGFDVQHQAHTVFVNRLVEVTYTDLNKIDENQEEYLHELLDFLLTWLTNHILKLDKQIPSE
ncbi:MAG: bacteriohemerythrin [Lachnospiraceae bacterium]|nr:bacteriohemerythrin [Lachnospiraceae bacterium]